ncbi:MAG: CDP-diacylglycerol--glycerol-3-phosphate 3-phosphatidyltransferase [Magnetococcales bacterium]|nr:CDP-diacylglycerol--glycerol-3-phosphate 3-phosphatidyltransferase [Magnetococcales bacterium]
MNLPNTLTLFRIILVPVFLWYVMEHNHQVAFWLFVVAGVTDGVDGFIARRFNQMTALGAILDPLADKVLIISGFLVLGMLEYLPYWLVLLIVGRELVVFTGALAIRVIDPDSSLKPTGIGKLNTLLQISLLAVVLGSSIVTLPGWLVSVLIIMVVCTTILSGLIYLWRWGSNSFLI